MQQLQSDHPSQATTTQTASPSALYAILKLGAALTLVAVLLIVETFTLHTQLLAISLLLVTGLFDVFDNRIAAAASPPSRLAMLLDRGFDFPMLLVLIYLVGIHINLELLLSKLAIDLTLLALAVIRPWSSRLSPRTLLQYATLFALLLIGLGMGHPYLNAEFIHLLLLANIGVSVISLLYHLGILHTRLIADLLSMCNLVCGLLAIYMVFRGRVDLALLFILCGALFDGLDGFAARKFGGTRFGVYSDDIADGVSYGIAPGASLILYLGARDPDSSVAAWIIGVCYTIFTISRLVFFTLNKTHADPNYFRGVPSTLGALLVLCACYLFSDQLLLITFMTGVACILMINFDTQYRHLGRLFQQRRLFRRSAALFSVGLLLAGGLGYAGLAILVLFIATLGYGFLPTILHFRRLLGDAASG